MKSLNLILTTLFLAIGLFSCSSTPQGANIEATLDGAEGLTAYFDRLSINGPSEVLKNAPIGNNGSFAFNFEKGLKPGIYQLRVGAQKAAFPIDDENVDIDINGNLADFGRYAFEIEGSDDARNMVAIMSELSSNSQTLESLTGAIDRIENSQAAAFVAFNTLARAGADGLETHKAVIERLDAADPMRASYTEFVGQLEQQIAQMRASELIQVGQPAPNIDLASPDGTRYSLADLKGNVVLLDFWASWCGPCRRENPNVVKVYDKYKDQGFTIYSVSLDGPDPRRTQGYSDEQLSAAMENHKERWVAAIAKDGLSWDYHVSELKKWSGEASATYGVRGIPRTFLIDRDGKIAAVGLRGAAEIERELQKVL